MQNHKKNTLIVGFININGIPNSNKHEKNNPLYQSISNFNADIIGLAEVNQHWMKIDSNRQWKMRTMGWWESSHASISYNRIDLQHHNSFQPGGIILQSINQISYRVCDSGIDPVKLGRWTWTKLIGRQNIALRVVCANLPCKPSSIGMQTVYSQHKRVFDS